MASRQQRRTTTKDVALLLQLKDAGQLKLAPEFQRNAVWPRAAKAYLIDTILSGRPIPVLYFQRGASAQTGRPEYSVIDGQQRLRAVFDFLENKFSLTESASASPWHKKRWKALEEGDRMRLLDYDFVVEELSGYQTEDIIDMFKRMNRYVVPLNAQERRHADYSGAFKDLVEDIGSWTFWTDRQIFSKNAANRRRADEFVSELLVLLLEGPQDKKATLDLYYTAFAETFPVGPEVEERLKRYCAFIDAALPDLPSLQLRRPANFYALVGAIDSLLEQDISLLETWDPKDVGQHLRVFDARIQEEEPDRLAARFVRAASRQTDNLQPRETRISVLLIVLPAPAVAG